MVDDWQNVDAADLELLQIVRDRRAGALAVVAVHDTALGPAHGGIRRRAYPGLGAAVADAVALATAMTWKCALAGLPAGGGKVVLLDQPGLDRAAAYRRVGQAIAALGGQFRTGPDVGTTSEDLSQVSAETSFVSTGIGGEGDLGLATARGVEAAMQALVEQLGADWHGLRVALQGLGSVGMALAELLAQRGVRLVVADVDPNRAAAVQQRLGAEVVAPSAIASVRCDVFSPCAFGGVLTVAAADAMQARGVCGAANNQFADPAAAARFAARGILVVPDFVANAGAVIAGLTFAHDGRPVRPERLARIGATARQVLVQAAAAGLPPDQVALTMAKERVAQARAARHR